MGRLDGKVAIVTGGVQGIGEGVALRCAGEGARVVIGDLQEDDATAKKIEGEGGEAKHVVMDVRQPQEWDRLLRETESAFGGVDLLGNIAGVVNKFGPDNAIDLTEEGWDFVVGTDMKGVWLGMQACIPRMLERGGGSIVNISSMAALKGLDNLLAYSAAKGGVIGMSQQVAFEYGRRGIRCNVIAPGTINTPILKEVVPSALENFEDAHIIHRLGEPADIAAAMAFLFSDDADFITGHVLPVDGGWNAKGSTGVGVPGYSDA